MNNANQRNPSVQLALNGKPVYLYNMIATVSVKREQKDMSGQKSSTKKTDKGVKAKEMTITGLIPYNRREWLTELFALAEAEDGKGEQTKYRISSISAEAANMREVQFSDSLTAYEQEDKLAWQISFTLREINSVAEKKESRKKKPKAKVQTEKTPSAQPEKSASQPTTNDSKTEKTAGTEKDDSFWGKVNSAIGE